VGASVPCIPFSECENGTGYVPLLGRRLRTSHEVTVTNLGIPEAVLSPAIQAVARANGRDVFANFVEREVPFVPATSTLVTVLGGPNDALALVDAIEKGAAGTTAVRTYIDTQVAAFGADYDKLIKDTQQRAPGAFIVLLNMPNLAGLPFAVNAGQPVGSCYRRCRSDFPREANRRAGAGVVVVDLMCDPQVYDRTRYSSDGFHPNDAGYAYLADSKLLPVVNGASSSPASTCGQMTMVPNL
jgi:lysophospholipase L1-like esterase